MVVHKAFIIINIMYHFMSKVHGISWGMDKGYYWKLAYFKMQGFISLRSPNNTRLSISFLNSNICSIHLFLIYLITYSSIIFLSIYLKSCPSNYLFIHIIIYQTVKSMYSSILGPFKHQEHPDSIWKPVKESSKHFQCHDKTDSEGLLLARKYQLMDNSVQV